MGWHPSHTLEKKIEAAQEHGIKGLELNMKDLNLYAEQQSITPLEAAKQTSSRCKAAGIEIFAIVAFEHFEGEPTPLEGRLQKARNWMNIAHELECTILQVPSNFTPNAIGDEKVIVA